MIHLLAKRLIPNFQRTEDPAVRRGYGVLCGLVGICLNVPAVFGEIPGRNGERLHRHHRRRLQQPLRCRVLGGDAAGVQTGGPGAGPAAPLRPRADGYISGLVVSMLILLMGVELLKSSVEKILHPEAVSFSVLAMAILAVSMAVKFYMSCYNRAIGRKIDSSAMLATATDSRSDVLATGAVLLSTVWGISRPSPSTGGAAWWWRR